LSTITERGDGLLRLSESALGEAEAAIEIARGLAIVGGLAEFETAAVGFEGILLAAQAAVAEANRTLRAGG
jgi:hypothetical protein